MRTFSIDGVDIIVTGSRNINESGFHRACHFIEKFNKKIFKLEKSSVIILQDSEHNSIVIERMNTDTFTLQIQYEVQSLYVYQIN